MIEIDLPFPPSTNNLFLNVPGRGRVPTKKYQEWRYAAGWQIQAVRPGKITGPVAIEIALSDHGRIDADNSLKAILDALVSNGVIEGDSKKYVREVRAYWVHPDIVGEGCRVSVRSLKGEGR